jgi:hypothetical protein
MPDIGYSNSMLEAKLALDLIARVKWGVSIADTVVARAFQRVAGQTAKSLQPDAAQHSLLRAPSAGSDFAPTGRGSGSGARRRITVRLPVEIDLPQVAANSAMPSPTPQRTHLQIYRSPLPLIALGLAEQSSDLRL